MHRLWAILFVALLGIPSFAFVAVTGAELAFTCEMNPYAGFTCPAIFAYLMPLAAVGIITIIPFLVVSTIWLGFEIVMKAIRRKNKP